MRYFITKNYSQYLFHMNRLKLNPNKQRYISSDQQLRGLRGIKVEKVGQYWFSPITPRAIMMAELPYNWKGE